MQQQWKGWVGAATLVMLAGCSTTGGSGESQVEGGAQAGSGIEGSESGMTHGIGLGEGLDGGLYSGSSALVAAGLDPQEINLLGKQTYRFDYDSSRIRAEDLLALDAHAKYLSSSVGQDQRVLIQGHTDERGAREYNLALGERRAQAVKQYLELRGVQSAQIEVVSYGEERPVNPASDDSAWAENRRAVLVPASSGYGK